MIVDISMGHQIAEGLHEPGWSGKSLQLTAMIVCILVVYPIGPGRLSLSQEERENIRLENILYAFSYLFWIHKSWKEDDLSLPENVAKCFLPFYVGHQRSNSHCPPARGNVNPKAQGQFSTHSLVAMLCHLPVLALVKILSSWCQGATCQY